MTCPKPNSVAAITSPRSLELAYIMECSSITVARFRAALRFADADANVAHSLDIASETVDTSSLVVLRELTQEDSIYKTWEVGFANGQTFLNGPIRRARALIAAERTLHIVSNITERETG